MKFPSKVRQRGNGGIPAGPIMTSPPKVGQRGSGGPIMKCASKERQRQCEGQWEGRGGVPAGQITKSSLKKDKEAVVGGAPSWCNTEVFLKRKAAGPIIKSLYNEYYYINID